MKGLCARRSALGVALLAGAACAPATTPVGGLLIEMNVDPSLSPDHLSRLVVVIGSTDGATTYQDASFAIDDAIGAGHVQFPTSVAIASNGDPKAGARIDLEVWNSTDAVDIERYEITDIPTAAVAELPVVFGSACAAGESLDGGPTACPLESWGCTWAGLWTCSAGDLPPAGADASLPAPSVARDTTVGTDAADATVADATVVGGNVDASEDTGSPTISCDEPCGAGLDCVDGVCATAPPSCTSGAPGAGTNCGLDENDDCCASDPVAGGSFWWDDAVDVPYRRFPASVSKFRLDRYEVTVGRFRAFVDAVAAEDGSAPWTPAPNSGRHTHLNDGNGLSNGGDAAPLYESGWDSSWETYLPQTKADWDRELLRCSDDSGITATWTSAAATDSGEKRPIDCINWYQAYAFCIWDGGFLPSDVEWDFAAAGGSLANDYAWGNTIPGPNAHLAIYDCYYPPLPAGGNDCEGLANVAAVGSAPAGAGVWGQLDLTGNVYEWGLDYASDVLPLPCVDCAQTAGGTQRGARGGSFATPNPAQLYNYIRQFSPPDLSHGDVGVRCARVP